MGLLSYGSWNLLQEANPKCRYSMLILEKDKKELEMRTSNTNNASEYLFAALTYAAAFAVLGYALFARLSGF